MNDSPDRALVTETIGLRYALALFSKYAPHSGSTLQFPLLSGALLVTYNRSANWLSTQHRLEDGTYTTLAVWKPEQNLPVRKEDLLFLVNAPYRVLFEVHGEAMQTRYFPNADVELVWSVVQETRVLPLQAARTDKWLVSLAARFRGHELMVFDLTLHVDGDNMLQVLCEAWRELAMHDVEIQRLADETDNEQRQVRSARFGDANSAAYHANQNHPEYEYSDSRARPAGNGWQINHMVATQADGSRPWCRWKPVVITHNQSDSIYEYITLANQPLTNELTWPDGDGWCITPSGRKADRTDFVRTHDHAMYEYVTKNIRDPRPEGTGWTELDRRGNPGGEVVWTRLKQYVGEQVPGRYWDNGVLEFATTMDVNGKDVQPKGDGWSRYYGHINHTVGGTDWSRPKKSDGPYVPKGDGWVNT